MEDTNEPKILETIKTPKRPLRLRWSDVAIFAVMIAGATGASIYLISHTHKDHEISAAEQLSTQVVTALSKQNTTALRSLGDKTFQASNSASSLDNQLRFKTTPPITFAAMYGDTKPTVDLHVVLNNARGQHVVFIYRYDKLKVPFYVRIDTIKPPHDAHWHLQALGADPNESNLTSPLPAGASSV
jgi:hypothetical protein